MKGLNGERAKINDRLISELNFKLSKMDKPAPFVDQLLETFGIDSLQFVDDSYSPEIDHTLIRRIINGQASTIEKDKFPKLIRTYRPWCEAWLKAASTESDIPAIHKSRWG